MKKHNNIPAIWFSLSLLLSSATLLAAVQLQHLGGYVPCPLCLEQRGPYALGALVLGAASIFASNSSLVKSTLWEHFSKGFGAIAMLIFIGSFYLGARHAGMEWGFWEGPANCSAALTGVFDAPSLLDKVKSTPFVSCTEPALRIAGLSLAGWNAVVSLILVALIGRGLFSSVMR